MIRLLILAASVSLTLISCERTDPLMDYKQEMREFVMSISQYSKSLHPGFIIIPQNGIELVTTTGEEEGDAHTGYLEAIDGNGQEDLFYGYDKDDKATPNSSNSYLRSYLDISKREGNSILVTDYCSTPAHMEASYTQNRLNGYISFAADHRELDNFPTYPEPIYSANSHQVTELSQIENFLYLINPENFTTKSDFIQAVNATNYDLVIMDLFFKDGTEFTLTEIEQIRAKANSSSRLVIAYMSIGEAEDYRYYWQTTWDRNPPSWLDKENPDWKGNFKVKYWLDEWQIIIYGGEDAYMDKILAAGFDGVYLDIIDAFEYFE